MVDTMDSIPGNEIKVAIRVRPLLPKEQAAGMKSRWHCTDSMISPDSSQASSCSYVFDRVFNEDISNRIVYEELASDIVKQAMIGFNGTLFTYGQSGSGKTYTIDALRNFAITSAYDYIENCPAREFLMRVSYIELYNEKLMDLLANDNTALTVREDIEKNVYIDGLNEIIVTSKDHVKNVLSKGNAKRTFAETKLNDRSSRAHCIFRLVIESRERDDPEHSSVYVSYLNLVDLAGSERAGENSGERLREGVSINLSLLTLSQVIRKLSGEQREFINYRDSKLTRILQNALEGNSKTAILCTVAPISVEETHSTLKFALNAKKVKTKPQQNEVLTDSAMLKKSQLEISKLKNKIKELEGRNSFQDDGELQLQKEKWENLIREVKGFLCVSSKAPEDKRFDKKRRETVCVPLIYRGADVKGPLNPSIIPKVRFFQPLQKMTDIQESPPINDSMFAVPHPLDSPCTSQECSCKDMSFTDFEKSMIQESVIEKFKSKKRKCKAAIAKLERENAKLRKLLGHKQFVTVRTRYEPNESLGPEFQNVVFDEEDENFETRKVLVNQGTEALDEGTTNTCLENETLRSEIVEYKEELDNMRAHLEALTERVVELDKIKEDYERTIAKLRDRICRDDEEIQTLKATEGERAMLYEEESKRWNENVKNFEPEESLLEIPCKEDESLGTAGVRKIEDKNDVEEMIKKQNEVLKEWEQMSKLREELNEEAKSVESRLCLLGEEKNRFNEEKDKLNEERSRLDEERSRLDEEKDRIHAEWNNLEKAHNDLRQVKEESSKEYDSAESIAERLHALQEENDHLRASVKTTRDLKRESKAFVHEIFGRSLEMNDCEESVDKTDESRVWELENRLQLQWENLKQAQEIFRQEREAFELGKLECINSETKLNEMEIFGGEIQGINRKDQERMPLAQSQPSQNNTLSREPEVEIVNDVELCLLEEERATLLKELESLKLSVSELNRRKEALEAETEHFYLKENSKGSARCQWEIPDVSEKGGLQQQWDILRKEQNEFDLKKIQLEEQEATVQSNADKCFILEEEVERLEKEVKLLREAQWENRRDITTLDVTEADIIDSNNVTDRRELLNDDAVHKEETLNLVKQKDMLQKEWDKLKKHQAELSRQEENVERKIERLCMLEEEKEQFEEEKDLFEREMDNLRQAQKDLMKEQEVFRQKELKSLNELEQNCQENVESRNIEWGTLKDDNNLLERSHRFERAEKELKQKKVVFEHQQEKCQGNKLQLERDEDVYKEGYSFTEDQRDLGIEREELRLEDVQIERNIWSGHDNESGNGISPHVEDESGIVTDISGGNTTLYRTVSDNDQVKRFSIHEENEKLSGESINLHHSQMEIKKEKSQRQNEEVMIQINSEESQILLEKKRLQQCMDKVKQDEENVRREQELLREKEEYVKQSIEKLHTLQEKEEQLQVEKEQLSEEKENLCDMKGKFQAEKEKFQQEKDALKREKEMFQGEKEGFHVEKGEENLRQELELLTGKEEYVQQSIQKLHTLQEKEEQLQAEKEKLCEKKGIFKIEKEIFQQKKEALKKEKELFEGKKDGFYDERDIVSDGRKDDENHIDKLCTQSKKRRFQNEIERFEPDQNYYKKEASSQTERSECIEEVEKKFENIKNYCECLQQKHEIVMVDEKSLQDDYDREEEGRRLEEEKARGRLEEEKNMLQEEWKNLKLAQEDLFREKNDLVELGKDYQKKTEQLQVFEEEQKRLQQLLDNLKQAEENVKREQEKLKTQEDCILAEMQRLQTLQLEKEMLHVEIERLDEQKSLLEKETERLYKETEILENKQTIFHEEKERFEQEKDVLQQEKERFEQEKDVLQQEKEELCKEKELFQDKIVVLEEEQAKCHREKSLLQDKNAMIEEELIQLQEEKDICEKKQAVLQKQQEELEKDTVMLQERIAVFQKEQDKHQKEIQKHQEEKILLQIEKDRLHEVEKNVREKSEKLNKAQDCIEKSREELSDKEQSIESRIERACIFEDERQRFEEAVEKHAKAHEDLRKEKISLNERVLIFEKEKKRLQKELESVNESRVYLDKDRDALVEKEKSLIDERERLQSGWESLRQSQDELKKEQDEFNQKFAEIDEKMAAVEQNTLGKDVHTEQTEQLRELEEELECTNLELDKAEKKIEDLHNLITKGKAMLAEKIELAKQANDRSKELEESTDVLKSELKIQSSLVDTKSDELEKLKKVQENYRAAIHERDNLKKEIEALTKGRAGDKKYFEDIIRQLKLKQRDAQNAEASFIEQREHSSQSGPSIDQMRRVIEFENAAKFLELTALRKTVEEQKVTITSLEAEREQLQADCKALQLHVDNEAMRSTAMLSTANQTTFAKRRIEEELEQLRKKIKMDPSQSKNASSVDEATQILRSQLEEKDRSIDELSKAIEFRNVQWNAIALKHKELIQQNRAHQKTVAELQKENAEAANLRTECAELVKLREDSAELTRLRKGISEHKTTMHSNSEEMTALYNENAKLRETLRKLKLERQGQKNQQHRSGSQENLEPQQPQPTQHSSSQQQTLVYKYGGAVESFTIAVQERKIRDLEKQLVAKSEVLLKEIEQNRSSSSQKSFESDVKESNEEPRHKKRECTIKASYTDYISEASGQ